MVKVKLCQFSVLVLQPKTNQVKMIKKVTLLLLLLSLFQISIAQEVTVVNSTDLSPVENVAVFNLDKTKSQLTNEKGKADLSIFSANDTLIFQHTGFFGCVMTTDHIRKMNYQVKLSKRTINLNPIIISAHKWEQKREEIPNKIVTISAKEIAFENPQTSADLLEASNEVFVQKSQLGGGSPMIRGFAANSVLLVVDGVRMNNAIYRSGNLQNVISIDPNSIENAEVIFGPGSVIYGSDALGGVMDFHTKKVKLAVNKNCFTKANALLRFSSADLEKTTHFDFNYGRKKWGLLTSVSFSDFDDLRQGNAGLPEFDRKDIVERINGIDSIVKNDNYNVQKPSGYWELNILQKIRFKPSEYLDLNYAFYYSTTSDIPRYDRLIQTSDNKLKYAKWYYGPQKWMMNRLSLELTKPTTLYDEVRFLLAYQNVEESRYDRKLNKNDLRERTENVQIATVNIDFNKEVWGNTQIFYGIESFYNYVESTAFNKNIESGKLSPESTRYPDEGTNYSGLAAYLSLKLRLSDHFTFLAGARYSHIFLNSKFSDTSFFKFPFDRIKLNTGAVNGSIGLVYRPQEQWQFNTNLSSGFRAPNLDDIAKVFDSEPGCVIVPNDNLKPEYAYNAEVGVIKKFGLKAKLDITLFYTYIADVMVRRDFLFNGQDSILYDGELSKVQAVVNAGYAHIYGGSASFYADVSEHFSLKTFLTYTKGEDDEGEPLRHVAPLFGSASLIFKMQQLKLEFNCDYNGEISYENLAPSERTKTYMYAKDKNGEPYSPAWFTLNFTGSYQLNKTFQVNFGIENILDKRYRPYSSGISAPGINFIIALRGTF